MSNGYVPIQFPTCVYGPEGDAITVPTATVLATMPPTFTAGPPAIAPTVVVAAPIAKVVTAPVRVKNSAPMKKER